MGENELITKSNLERLKSLAVHMDSFVESNSLLMYRHELTENTLRAHDSDLKNFVDFIFIATGCNLEVNHLLCSPKIWSFITFGVVKTFIEYLINQGYALGTVNRHLATIRKYVELAFKSGYMKHEQYALIKTVKGYTGKRARNRDEKRIETRITDENGQPVKKAENVQIPDSVVKSLKHDHDLNTPQGRRDKVMMCLLLDHAMRASEVSALTVGNVNFETETIRFYHVKTDDWQTDELSPDSLSALKAYKQDMLSGDKPLIRSSKKNNELVERGISARTVTRIVNKLGKQHGLDRLSACDCRHSWATRAYKGNTHPQDIMSGGGWKTMTMVNRYTDKLEISNERVILSS